MDGMLNIYALLIYLIISAHFMLILISATVSVAKDLEIAII